MTTRGRARPVATSSSRSKLGHQGQELAGADERHGSGHPAGSHACRGYSGRRLTRPDAAQRRPLGAAILGSAIVFLDGTIVNLALPSIGRELPAIHRPARGPDLRHLRLPRDPGRAPRPRRRPRRHYGRRRIFVIGLVGFGATSLLCGLAPTLEVLVVGRLLQGAAGALLVPGSLSIITATFEGAGARPGVRDLGAATSALTTSARRSAASSSSRSAGGPSSWSTCRSSRSGCRAMRYMPESRGRGAGALRLARGARRRRRGRRARVRRDSRLAGALAGSGSRSCALGLGAVALVAFPFLMARRPDPLVPLGAVPAPDVQRRSTCRPS